MMLAESGREWCDESIPSSHVAHAVVMQAVDGTPEADAALSAAVHRVRDMHSRCVGGCHVCLSTAVTMDRSLNPAVLRR